MPRPTDWIDTRVIMSAVSGGQARQSLMTGVAPVNMRGMTVIRTIVVLGMISQDVAGAWGIQQIDLAIGVASQEAFAAGVVPDPNSDTDKPPRGWVFRSQRLVAQNGVGHQVVFPLEMDIRGARKIENGELYVVANNTFVNGTSFTVKVQGLVRTLYKL